VAKNPPWRWHSFSPDTKLEILMLVDHQARDEGWLGESKCRSFSMIEAAGVSHRARLFSFSYVHFPKRKKEDDIREFVRRTWGARHLVGQGELGEGLFWQEHVHHSSWDPGKIEAVEKVYYSREGIYLFYAAAVHRGPWSRTNLEENVEIRQFFDSLRLRS